MNNRYSIAPGKNTGNNRNFNSQIKNNVKENRKSTLPNLNWQRQTTINTLKSSSDPRPIKDIAFQNECMTKILNFLIQESYNKNLSLKDLTCPQAKDFISIFTFILEKIIPNSNFTINKLDEDLPIILNELRYPGYIGKSHLTAVGAPNIWPHLLGLLTWMVELATYLLYDQAMEFQERNERININNIDLQNHIFDKYYHEFLIDGYNQNLNKNDISEAKEDFLKKVKEMINYNYEINQKLVDSTKTIEDKMKEIFETNNSLNEIRKKVDNTLKEIDQMNKNKSSIEKQINAINLNIDNRSKIHETKNEKNKELQLQQEDLNSIIKNQKVSYEDYEKMKHSKVNYEKEIQCLEEKNKELNDTIFNIENQIQNFKKISDKTNNIKSILERNNKLDLEINIEKCIENISTLDYDNLKEQFSIINQILSVEIEKKQSDIKIREENLINLNSQIFKLDDDINELSEVLKMKEHENEKKTFLCNSEKERYNMLLNQKNEEFNKLEENNIKSINIKTDKEKEYEDSKNREILLNNKYLERESETDNKIKDLEKEYIDLFKEVEKTKSDNIKEIKSNIRTCEKIFETIRKEI